MSAKATFREKMIEAAIEAEEHLMECWSQTHSRDDAIGCCRYLGYAAEQFPDEDLWEYFELFKDQNPWAAKLVDDVVFS